tara:strand:- start:52 stop:624 length:573 start_codon:yes stop_codon:yes gene_type:complete
LSLLYNISGKWAFIHIPKTAGTSINKILLTDKNTKFLTSHDSIRLLPEDDLYTFTFVRNPYTRFLSAWNHGVRKNKYTSDLKDFIKNINLNDVWLLPQSYYINEGKTKNKKVNFIGKYENLKKDFQIVLNKVGIQGTLEHLNRNPIYNNHPTLNQENYYLSTYKHKTWVRDFVKETYYNDFKIFNYDMDI